MPSAATQKSAEIGIVSNRVLDVLDASSAFANRLDDVVARPGGFPTYAVADKMMVGYWAIDSSIHNSILTLFRDNFPAGAFALFRPVCEVLVRVHLIAMGDKQAIEQMRTDKFRTKFFKDPKKVDNHFHLGGQFNSLYVGMMNFLHSTAHMGMEQLRRQFNGTEVVANYSEEQIVALANMSTLAKILITARVVERFQTAADQEIVLSVLKEFTERNF